MQYRTLSKIQRDAEIIEPGTLLDLADQEAATLLAVGSIELAAKPFSMKLNPLVESKRGS